MITGDRPTINYRPQQATDGGTNVTVCTPASGPVTVSGAERSSVGSQIASGANSNVVGSQVAQGDHNAIAAWTPPTSEPRSSPRKRDGGRGCASGACS